MFDLNRPRRSVLYMPGSNQRALEKAKTLAADVLILDLEDAVAPDAKAQARQLVCDAVKSRAYGKREVVIRINGLDTDWGMDDLRAASEAGPDAILIPKTQSVAMVEEVECLMQDYGAPSHTFIWAMMETPRGVLHAEAIATSTSRLTCFVMGTNDLAVDLGALQTADRAPLMTSLSLCLLAARSYGMAIVDGVYNAFKDEDGFRDRCAQSRAMGFDGKTLIHPGQLAISNAAFGPDPEAVETAKAQIRAFEEAAAKGEGVAVLDGKIVENLHADAARRLLVKANAIHALEAVYE